jgi:molybdopterin molybdotransferase
MVKDVLTQRGDINFWSVRMRPAKPLAFGHLRGKGGRAVPLLGLPGNPVSAMVAFEVFARPAIRAMLGRTRLARPMVEGVLTGPIYNLDGRRVYARVEVERRNGVYYASPTGPQGSNILTSMARANGLAICPEDLPSKQRGEKVRIIMLDWNEEVDL